MTPAEIGLAVNIISGLGKTALGAWQLGESKNIDTTRPGFEIPNSAKKSLANAEVLAGKRMAGYEEGTAAIDQNLARTSRKIAAVGGSSPEMLAATIAAASGANDNILELTTADAGNRANSYATLRDELGKMSEWETKKWEWDKKGKYEENAASAGSLGNAGINNIDRGATGILGALATQGKLLGGNNMTKTTGDASMINNVNTPDATKSSLENLSPESKAFITKAQGANSQYAQTTLDVLEAELGIDLLTGKKKKVKDPYADIYWPEPIVETPADEPMGSWRTDKGLLR
jgi:hypothetical protein